MRCLFLLLALGLGWSSQRVQAQTSEQVMTFAIICQYVTNLVTITNLAPQETNQYQQITTVFLDSANLAKAMSVQLFGTNWFKWASAIIVYEENLDTGNQGIYLRQGIKQTNVSSFFTNGFSTNGFANMFSQDVAGAYGGVNYATLPLHGGWDYLRPGTTTNNFTGSDNLAYLTFTSPNTSFTLLGYSQGMVVRAAGYFEGTLHETNLTQGEIFGAGTFSLNVTTNIYRTNSATSSPFTNYTGLAHGTVYLNKPYFLPIGPPEGP